MAKPAGLIAYQLSFQLSPIILTGGIAQRIPGFMLPIIAITESINFGLGLLSGGDDVSLDDFFANYQPISGGTLIANEFGNYTFANQATAANAVIAQGNSISLHMDCPARGDGAFGNKLAILTALVAAINQHNNTGGTYTVMTPGQIYTNCVLRGLKDVSALGARQPQSAFQWDFWQPLLTLDQAALAMGSLTSKIDSGLPTDGSLSGAGASVGSPLNLAAPSLIPAASNTAGTNVASYNGTGVF